MDKHKLLLNADFIWVGKSRRWAVGLLYEHHFLVITETISQLINLANAVYISLYAAISTPSRLSIQQEWWQDGQDGWTPTPHITSPITSIMGRNFTC